MALVRCRASEGGAGDAVPEEAEIVGAAGIAILAGIESILFGIGTSPGQWVAYARVLTRQRISAGGSSVPDTHT
jgi:hypothetical protein